MKCPVEGCSFGGVDIKSSRGLLLHLLRWHKKVEIADALVDKVEFEAMQPKKEETGA